MLGSVQYEVGLGEVGRVIDGGVLGVDVLVAFERVGEIDRAAVVEDLPGVRGHSRFQPSTD